MRSAASLDWRLDCECLVKAPVKDLLQVLLVQIPPVGSHGSKVKQTLQST